MRWIAAVVLVACGKSAAPEPACSGSAYEPCDMASPTSCGSGLICQQVTLAGSDKEFICTASCEDVSCPPDHAGKPAGCDDTDTCVPTSGVTPCTSP